MTLVDSKESFESYYTKKYTFKNKHNVSSVYVKRDDKDIICLSSMYGCPVGCKFCKSGQNYFGNVKDVDIIFMIDHIVKDKQLGNRKIVFSFMGSGEPFLNPKNVLNVIGYIVKKFNNFSISISTSGLGINNLMVFNKFFEKIGYYPQIQLSLHSLYDGDRRTIIPKSPKLGDILDLLLPYKGKIEMNYVLMHDFNDSDIHAVKLAYFIRSKYLFLKINDFHEVDGSLYFKSKRKKEFIDILKKHYVEPEVYSTDGVDIGAACGQLESK